MGEAPGEEIASSGRSTMFFILKLALVTCVFYVGVCLLMEAVLLAVVYLKGGVFYFVRFWPWFGIFSVVWFICFTLAWRFVAGGLNVGTKR